MKTNVISAAVKKKQCLLLGEACLAACSRGWVQHCGRTLLLNVFLFVFSADPETLSLHRDEKRRQRGGLYWETNSCRYCGAVPVGRWQRQLRSGYEPCTSQLSLWVPVDVKDTSRVINSTASQAKHRAGHGYYFENL